MAHRTASLVCATVTAASRCSCRTPSECFAACNIPGALEVGRKTRLGSGSFAMRAPGSQSPHNAVIFSICAAQLRGPGAALCAPAGERRRGAHAREEASSPRLPRAEATKILDPVELRQTWLAE